jgi:hypothetical protein
MPSPELPILIRELSMGMRIGHPSANNNSAQGIGASNWQQRQQSVKDMMSALQSGDLAAAQKAFGSLPGSANIAASDSNSPLAQIGKALQAGDLASAQQAAQAWQNARAAHHHHAPSQATATAPGAASTATAGAGAILNLIA